MAISTLAMPLTGDSVRLVPLLEAHAEGLHAAFRDADLWTWQGHQPPTPEATLEWVRQALTSAAAGTEVPFVIETLTGELAGTTRYMDIRWNDAAVEIGWTMVFAPFRRTRTNTEVKYLLLKRAFEELGMERVQLKTDALNVRSRAAIERIGARFEGILRSHKRRPNGTLRDTAFFSVLLTEWPQVRTRLEARLN